MLASRHCTPQGLQVHSKSCYSFPYTLQSRWVLWTARPLLSSHTPIANGHLATQTRYCTNTTPHTEFTAHTICGRLWKQSLHTGWGSTRGEVTHSTHWSPTGASSHGLVHMEFTKCSPLSPAAHISCSGFTTFQTKGFWAGRCNYSAFPTAN